AFRELDHVGEVVGAVDYRAIVT
ncbi:MAG: hypothetical protein JWL94_587, partial [Microbacteriaceae bacterium]|nr:hypothetical protein [Microbacteriaceae bacterium]